jgi:hypothetical protein
MGCGACGAKPRSSRSGREVPRARLRGGGSRRRAMLARLGASFASFGTSRARFRTSCARCKALAVEQKGYRARLSASLSRENCRQRKALRLARHALRLEADPLRLARHALRLSGHALRLARHAWRLVCHALRLAGQVLKLVHKAASCIGNASKPQGNTRRGDDGVGRCRLVLAEAPLSPNPSPTRGEGSGPRASSSAVRRRFHGRGCPTGGGKRRESEHAPAGRPAAWQSALATAESG